MKIDKQTGAILVSLATIIAGGVDNKMAVNRLEASVAAIEKRVERIENRLEQRAMAQADSDAE